MKSFLLFNLAVTTNLKIVINSSEKPPDSKPFEDLDLGTMDMVIQKEGKI